MAQRLLLTSNEKQHRSLDISPESLINLFPIDRPEGTRTRLALSHTPGIVEFGSTITAALVRPGGMIASHDGQSGYVVIADTFYTVAADGTKTSKGTLSTSTGAVSMARGTDKILIVDGTANGRTYDFDTDTFANITDVDFPVLTDVDYKDTFFVGVSTDAKFYVSLPDDPTSWQALDFATAESSPDDLIGIKDSDEQLWLIGETSTEIWFSSGEDFPFSRNRKLSWGCHSSLSIANYDKSVYWLGRDESGSAVIIKTQGSDAQPISHPDLNRQLELISTKSDAIAYVYTEDGHPFYVLTFPTSNKTFALDLTSNRWHNRTNAAGDRFTANCYMHVAGKHIIGDFESGKLYQQSLSLFNEDGTNYSRTAILPTIWNDNNDIICGYIEIDMESGVGNADTVAPTITLEVSRDGGHTYRNSGTANIGGDTAYNTRQRWRRLGQAKQFTFKFTYTGETELNILGVYAELVGSGVRR